MNPKEANLQWEKAAPGWAKWEDALSKSVQSATDAMLEMADVVEGKRVLDLASGAGNQTLRAARKVGLAGHIVANDISQTMLDHVERSAASDGLTNISTLLGAAQTLELTEDSFDAVICRFALMLFAEPEKVLSLFVQALKSGGKIAVVVFSTPQANPLLAKPMHILLKHAGKTPPPGAPSLFSLGGPGVLEKLFGSCGLVNIEISQLEPIFQMPSSRQMLEMMQEAFGAYRAVIGDQPESVQSAAWEEVSAFFRTLETDDGLSVPGEVLVGAAQKP